MLRSVILAAAVVSLSACATRVVPPPRQPAPQPVRPAPVTSAPQPTPPPLQRAPLPSVPAIEGRTPERAADAGLRPGPTVASLNLTPAEASRGLATFRTSCSAATRR